MTDMIETNNISQENYNNSSYFLDENIRKGRGNRVALYYQDKEITYNKLAKLTNKIGNALKDIGLEIENRVYLALHDSLEFVASFYAVQKIGAGVIVGYTYLSAKDYKYQINLLRPKVIIADASCIELLRAATKDSKYPKAFLILGANPSALMEKEFDFFAMVERANDQLEAELTHKDDYARWSYTGGSTGQPKVIPAPHSGLVYNFKAIQEIMNYTQDDIILPAPKMYFGYGRTGTIIHPFRVGAAGILFPERTTVKKFFELIAKHKPTILILVPTLIRKLLQAPKEERADFSCVRLCTSAGEALSSELYSDWKKQFGCEVIDMLGSAEMGYVYLSNRPGAVVPGSVGKPLAGYYAKIVDENGNELPDGEGGVLMAKGPSSNLFYWHELEKSKHTFRGEWVYTGDIFKRDPDGNFYFIGRSDDLVKVSGIWISPVEIENCIQGHPKVKDCAVVAIMDDDNLYQIKAYIALANGINANQKIADEIKDFTKKRLAPYKFPRFMDFMDELPTLETGKINRHLLKKKGL
jgi:benzoate-CoA ligase family protein